MVYLYSEITYTIATELRYTVVPFILAHGIPQIRYTVIRVKTRYYRYYRNFRAFTGTNGIEIVDTFGNPSTISFYHH